MLVSALSEAGVEKEVLQHAIDALLIHGLELKFDREERQQISGTRTQVLIHGKPADSDEHHHAAADSHSHHTERSYRKIVELVTHSHLQAEVKESVLNVFRRIAEAEAKVHGKTLEEIHFHEVGGEDSIADIVAACTAFHHLAPERIVCSRLFEGSGFIDCAHGRFPLPAPATAEILSGIPLRQIDEPYEFVTPTGAALLAEFVDEFAPMPEMAISSIGIGVGSRNLPERPNILRAMLGTASSTANPIPGLESDTVTKIECNIDDMSPELAGDLCQRILANGAFDCWLTPIQMKKGRPGFQISVLAGEDMQDALCALVLEHSSTFGVRLSKHSRRKYPRKIHEVNTRFGTVRVKLALVDNQAVKCVPEFEDCRRVAAAAGVPVSQVMQEAVSIAIAEEE